MLYLHLAMVGLRKRDFFASEDAPLELAQPFLAPNWDVVDMCLGRHFLVRRKKGLGRTPSILLPTNLSFFRGCQGSSARLFEDNQASRLKVLDSALSGTTLAQTPIDKLRVGVPS